MSIHTRFNADFWAKEIPLQSLRRAHRVRAEKLIRDNPREYASERKRRELLEWDQPHAEMVYGPREMTVIEQLRSESGAARGHGVPTDVFVWGIGEPKHPAATRIGGRPFRPRGMQWPKAEDGKPMGLLAQFCFADSRDVLRDVDLPGDLMLVFAPGPFAWSDWDPDDPATYVIEWHSLTDDLVQPASAPLLLDLAPAYCQIHRTVDYPQGPEDGLSVIGGSKIGGVPDSIQADPETPGVHVCTLGSLNPFGDPWPMLNVSKNPGGQQYLDSRLLMIGDLGAAYFFVDREGTTRWSADCG